MFTACCKVGFGEEEGGIQIFTGCGFGKTKLSPHVVLLFVTSGKKAIRKIMSRLTRSCWFVDCSFFIAR